MRTLVRLITIVALGLAPIHAKAQPVLPCPVGETVIVPAYGDLGGPPAVHIWQDIDVYGREACVGPVRGRMALVVALAGRFDGPKSLDDIASRIGAISATQGLLYWSTTGQRWRPLISEAFALEDRLGNTRRLDFSAQEILSGRTLYFAQNDTRSTGLNIYSLSARLVGSERLAVEVVNLTTIRFALVTSFEPQALRSVHFIDRLVTNVWGYYGISAVQVGAVKGREKSFINRAGAFYRFLIGVRTDVEPPLAP